MLCVQIGGVAIQVSCVEIGRRVRQVSCVEEGWLANCRV